MRSARAYHSAVNAVFVSERLSDKVILSMNGYKRFLNKRRSARSAVNAVFVLERLSDKVLLSMHGY